MTRTRLITAGAATAIIVLLLYVDSCRDRQRGVKEGVLQERVAQDSIRFERLKVQYDSLNRVLKHQVAPTLQLVDRWRTITERIPGQPGADGRIDSVFKDSAFAALPDSMKVKVLASIGSQAANACHETVTTCEVFRRSADSTLVAQDSLAKDKMRLHLATPHHRRWGFGVTGGYGATRAPSGQIYAGPTVTVGLNIRF